MVWVGVRRRKWAGGEVWRDVIVHVCMYYLPINDSVQHRVPTERTSKSHLLVSSIKRAPRNWCLPGLLSFGLIPLSKIRDEFLCWKAVRSLIIADIVLKRYCGTDVLQSLGMRWQKVAKKPRVATVRNNSHKEHCKIRNSAKKTMLNNYSLVYSHPADLLTFVVRAADTCPSIKLAIGTDTSLTYLVTFLKSRLMLTKFSPISELSYFAYIQCTAKLSWGVIIVGHYSQGVRTQLTFGTLKRTAIELCMGPNKKSCRSSSPGYSLTNQLLVWSRISMGIAKPARYKRSIPERKRDPQSV